MVSQFTKLVDYILTSRRRYTAGQESRLMRTMKAYLFAKVRSSLDLHDRLLNNRERSVADGLRQLDPNIYQIDFSSPQTMAESHISTSELVASATLASHSQPLQGVDCLKALHGANGGSSTRHQNNDGVRNDDWHSLNLGDPRIGSLFHPARGRR